MTMDDIFNGKESHFPGLIPLVFAYLDYIKCDQETFNRVEMYLQFIKKYFTVIVAVIDNDDNKIQLLLLLFLLNNDIIKFFI